MNRRWKGEVYFLFVYIREAHPWPRGSKKKGKTVIPEPLTLEERARHGQTCNDDLGLTIPMVLDGMDNAVGKAWAAWPDRLYVLDAKGKIVMKGKPGPWGFFPSHAERAFRKLLGKWPKMI